MHVAILPDGSVPWAAARGLSRLEGHCAGVESVCRVIAAAPRLGVGVVTIHALSRDGRRRQAREARSILACIRTFLEREIATCVRAGVRVTALGRRDRLSAGVRRAIESAERATAGGAGLHLRLAIDYSAREAIRSAFSAGEDGPVSGLGPDVDLLVRTGGEQRLGDFLLWECAHAELYFVDTPWPEFGEGELEQAIAEFQRRERRSGALSEAASREAPAPLPETTTRPGSPADT